MSKFLDVKYNPYLQITSPMKFYRHESRVGPVTDRDKQISEKILTLWTNFAKSGNPNPRQDDNPKDPLKDFVWEPTQKHSHKLVKFSSLLLQCSPLNWITDNRISRLL